MLIQGRSLAKKSSTHDTVVLLNNVEARSIGLGRRNLIDEQT